MKICIIGAGNTGQAVAVYLNSIGVDCVLYSRSEAKVTAINNNGITSDGGIRGKFTIPVSLDLHEAVSGADLLLVMTIANAHKEVADRLKPIVFKNQNIIIFNSNWGAYEFKQVLGDDIEKKNLTVAETNAQLFTSSSKSTGQIHMQVKKEVNLSATRQEQTRQLLKHTREIFPQFRPGSSIIETSMASSNPVIHVPIVILNLVRVENSQPFLFYGEGVSSAAVSLIQNVDNERVAVAKKIGIHVADVLTVINSFWEIKHDNLFDALTKNQSYAAALGPKTLNHRYITEDVPFGIIPIAALGDLFGVDTPYTDSVVDIMKNTIDPDLISGGVKFRKEDFNKPL